MSEEFCQLLHFDRSGAQYTSPFNIHLKVNTFIRVVLGLSSFDEQVAGLDTAVQWTVEDGRKVSGAMTVTDAAGSLSTYTLCDVEPTFRRFDLHGRGTIGWRVKSSEGHEYFVKDCWGPAGGLAEHVVLAQAAGQGGLVQMVTFEGREESTAHLRANGDESWSPEHFSNRFFSRVVMEHCGASICEFESQKQLIAAIRDAIAGEPSRFIITSPTLISRSAHQALVNKHDILHRDISQNNILLGKKGAPIGDRGKLIDFDMAFSGPRPLAQTRRDVKAVRIFLFRPTTQSDDTLGNHFLHVGMHACGPVRTIEKLSISRPAR